MEIRIGQAVGAVARDRVYDFYDAHATEAFLKKREWKLKNQDAYLFFAEREDEIIAVAGLHLLLEGRYAEIFAARVPPLAGGLRPWSLHAIFTYVRAHFADTIEQSVAFAAPLLGETESREKVLAAGLKEWAAPANLKRAMLDSRDERLYFRADDDTLATARQRLAAVRNGSMNLWSTVLNEEVWIEFELGIADTLGEGES